ncbi:MAG: tRNA lysidine(34) synthetase TilS [Paracoccus sp. (in: a-proteobacteria)]|uniref:tRNA lysidine(34) synthetase TilS n=1 Tax=Paracoccus sp. TaxID=267 RepID=UPI0026DF1DD1|nr:tRNA lysidine(34) synthetase TilS [Paracoccus sp. (in: a-proteobacteria)]MDO5632092.1 tRNA lysidine(34) synthetase TilS [Paracoccus sp. (in: a-proteobacteria)]
MADTASTEAHVRAALDRLAGDMPAVGIALSGGGDSTALLHMAHGWGRGRRLMAATVDHGLRPESAAEARAAQKTAESLGIAHVTLLWQRDTTEGNLMANARDARLRLLSGWARHNDLSAVLLGHTQDDQAETLLMRLARGAGVDGLAAMAEWRDAFGVRWLRPMLRVSRASLRDWLTERNLRWIDDPSNDNDDFDRIRIRKAMAALQLDAAALAQSAQNIAQARDALAYYAAQTAGEAVADRGSLILPRAPFRHSPPEVQRRLAVAAARWITGADYPPRRATVAHALAALAAGSRVTLDGALFCPTGDRIRVIREPAAAMRAPANDAPVWDNRWRIEGLSPGETVAAVGYESLDQVNWRLSGLSRDEAAATPAIRADGRLLATPVLQPQAPWRVEPLRNAGEFGRLVHLH